MVYVPEYLHKDYWYSYTVTSRISFTALLMNITVSNTPLSWMTNKNKALIWKTFFFTAIYDYNEDCNPQSAAKCDSKTTCMQAEDTGCRHDRLPGPELRAKCLFVCLKLQMGVVLEHMSIRKIRQLQEGMSNVHFLSSI